MDIYEKLIDNPLFFKWIYFPSEELEMYWQNYMEQYPGQSAQILKFKQKFEEHFKYKNEQLGEIDKKKLAQRILRKMDKVDQRNKRKTFIYTFMRYAAVALLFFVTGSSLVYLYMESRQSELVIEGSVLPAPAQGPILIIGNDQQIQLNQGKSELDYSRKDEIIVDQKTLNKRKDGKTPEMNTLVIPYGNRSLVTLADGSRVWLNAGSRLIYPSVFKNKTREVFLTGEAFFNVEKNQKQPFIVKTSDVDVKVLGTRFNISAYPEDYSIQTVLAEGSVEINRQQGGLFEKGITLIPGQLAYFNKKSQETRIFTVNIEHYISWTDGLFSFSNTDLNRIMKKLERYYNIHFQFDDSLKGSIQITGKLDVTKEQSEVFEYLSKLTGLKFIKISDNRYLIK